MFDRIKLRMSRYISTNYETFLIDGRNQNYDYIGRLNRMLTPTKFIKLQF